MHSKKAAAVDVGFRFGSHFVSKAPETLEMGFGSGNHVKFGMPYQSIVKMLVCGPCGSQLFQQENAEAGGNRQSQNYFGGWPPKHQIIMTIYKNKINTKVGDSSYGL